jgi:hypothetical protein
MTSRIVLFAVIFAAAHLSARSPRRDNAPAPIEVLSIEPVARPSEN